MRVPIPSRLETPPTGQSFLPPSETRLQTLPFGELTWENFERICLRLIRRDAAVDHAQIYGTAGQDQQGIDIFAQERSSNKHRVYQCKRENDFGPSKIQSAVKKFEAGTWFPRSSALILCAKESLRETKRAEEIVKQREHLGVHQVKFAIWDCDELTELLKHHADIIDDFFGREWVRAFLGEEAASRLSKRLDMHKTSALRQRLFKLYSTVFNEQDPGLSSTTAGVQGDVVAIEDRFVLPDIEDKRDVIIPSSDRTGSRPEHEAKGPEAGSGSTTKDHQPKPSLENQHYQRRIDAEEWLTAQQRSIILGKPGSGKSTLLRFIAIDLLSPAPKLTRLAQKWGNLLPVWVPFPLWTQLLTQPTKTTTNVRDVMHEWLNIWGEEDLWPLLQEALNDERLLLLVDGLDEWSNLSAAQNALQRLRVFAEQHNLPTAMTSRPHGFQLLGLTSAGWQVGVLSELSPDQQRKLCHTWLRHYHSSGHTAQHSDDNIKKAILNSSERFFQEVNRSGQLKDLASNPLLLSLLVYLWRFETSLPQNRFKAYEELVEHLIKTHPARRKTAAQSMREADEVSEDVLRDALAHLASTIHEEFPSGGIPEKEALRVIEAHLRDDELGPGLSPQEARQQGKNIVKFASDSSGILVKRSPTEIAFFHRMFQEYLAAKSIERRPQASQQEIVALRCTNPQWHEVILSLVFLTRQPDVIRKFVLSIKNAQNSLLNSLDTLPLLAEIAFGPFGTSPALAKEIAESVFHEVELGHWMPQRLRLLETVVGGLRKSQIRDVVHKKIAQWAFNRIPWRESIYAALGNWTHSPELMDCLWRGVYEDDIRDARAAARSFAKLANQGDKYFNQLLTAAQFNLITHIRSTTLEVLVEKWPHHEAIGEILARAYTAGSSELKIVAIKGRVLREEQTAEDLEWLLEHGVRRNEVDFTEKHELPKLIINGWHGSSLVKNECIQIWKASNGTRKTFYHPEIALRILLVGYSQDEEVAQLCADELDNREYPFLHDGDNVWPLLISNFRGNASLIPAIERWLPKQEYQENAVARAALCMGTTWAKAKLIEYLNFSYPHWAAGALLDGWGMDDMEVNECLTKAASWPAYRASQLGAALSRIIPDKTARRTRLLEIFRDAECARPDFVLEALALVRTEKPDEEIVTVAMQVMERTNKKSLDFSSTHASLIYHFFDDSRVRELARLELFKLGGNVTAVALACGDDAELRAILIDALGTLPTELRQLLIRRLGDSFGDGPAVIGILSRYDTESNASVRAQGSISYHSQTLVNDTEALGKLTSDIIAHRSETGEKRHAAFCGLISLERLDIFRNMQEPDWSKTEAPPNPNEVVSFSLNIHYHRPEPVTTQLVVQHWGNLKSILGSNFWVRLCDNHANELPNFCEAVAPFIEPRTTAAEDFLALLDGNKGRHAGSSTITCLERLRPKSQLLLDYCMHAIQLRGSLESQFSTFFDAAVIAAEVLGHSFGGDLEVLTELFQPFVKSGRLYNGSIVAMCEGWPESDELNQIVSVVRDRGIRLPPIAWFRLICTRASDQFVLSELADLLTSDKKPQPVTLRAISRALVKRIREDDTIANQLMKKISVESTPSESASLPRLLSAARGVSEDLRKACTVAFERQLIVPTVGCDLISGTYRPVAHALLDVLSPG